MTGYSHEAPVRLLAYTDAESWGGAEEVLATLLSRLESRFTVSAVAVDPNVLERIALSRPGTEAHLVPRFSGKWDLRSLRAHIQTFRANRPDICHLNLRVPSSCQAGIVAALLVTPLRIVVVEHLPLHNRSAFVRWTRRQASRLYAVHVAVGHATARAVETELSLPSGSLRVVHNGVVPPETIQEPPLGEASDTGPLIGTLGRLVPQKGHEILLEALVELPEARAMIVGEGPSRGTLEELACRLGVADRIQLPGWLDDGQRLLPMFDVFVLPSWQEGLPLALLHAMLAGVPTVASDVGSIREAIEDGHSGLLVPPGDAGALAEAVRTLLADGDRRRRVAAAARSAALTSFTADVMAARYEAIYDEVLA